MTRGRVVAALAAILTAMLLQATLIAPWTLPVPVSLPAVVVAAVALVDGPGSGLAFGFATGLLADLGSTHPAGVLALSWLLVGLACGLAADRRTVRADAATAATVCALATVVTGLLLAVLHSGGATAANAFAHAVPAGLGDALLALAVVPLTRAFLHADSLRAPHPVLSELDLAGPRG
ncbi:MAG: rod shape-determining protein MreD [Jatrophihabitantaceae bacterium]